MMIVDVDGCNLPVDSEPKLVGLVLWISGHLLLSLHSLYEWMNSRCGHGRDDGIISIGMDIIVVLVIFIVIIFWLLSLSSSLLLVCGTEMVSVTPLRRTLASSL